jgi:hypothetical protein
MVGHKFGVFPTRAKFSFKKKIKSKHYMGQRTNPNIFRLGKNKEWKSKYFEKNPLK